jgi:hypothetical protein
MSTGPNKLIKFPHACMLVPAVDGAKVYDRPSTHRPLRESQDLAHNNLLTSCTSHANYTNRF